MPIKRQKKIKEKAECVICAIRKINCKAVECHHQFCYRCLSKWGRRKGTCPLCRTNIRTVQYKNKIFSPQYLLDFDERILLSSQEESVQRGENIDLGQAPILIAPRFFYLFPFLNGNYFQSYMS